MDYREDDDLVLLSFPDGETWEDDRPGLLSAQRLRKWSLVLEARGIPCQARRAVKGWRLFVPSGCLEAALREISLYEKENRHWRPATRPVPLADNTLATLSVLGLLAIFFNLTHGNLDAYGLPAVDWMERGCAAAGKILDGEWWRALTSLTLHADGLHLLGNLAVGGVFVVMVCRTLGSGLGWSLTLLSGVLGSYGDAWLQAPDHQAVGASTALFGAVGLLAVFTLINKPSLLRTRWPLPLAAALVLLAMLGAGGEQVDIAAHLCGFGAGLLLGIGPGLWIRDHGRPGPLVNALLAAAAAAMVALAWRAALQG
jgi:membrane associated rhomboid family serine protease